MRSTESGVSSLAERLESLNMGNEQLMLELQQITSQELSAIRQVVEDWKGATSEINELVGVEDVTRASMGDIMSLIQGIMEGAGVQFSHDQRLARLVELLQIQTEAASKLRALLDSAQMQVGEAAV